jgi:hypothetical protein
LGSALFSKASIASIIPVHLGDERPRAIDTKWLHKGDGIECQLS